MKALEYKQHGKENAQNNWLVFRCRLDASMKAMVEQAEITKSADEVERLRAFPVSCDHFTV